MEVNILLEDPLFLEDNTFYLLVSKAKENKSLSRMVTWWPGGTNCFSPTYQNKVE